MAGETEIPKGLPPFVPLVKVPASTGFATHFLPMSGIATSGGEVSFLQTMFQPSRTDELDTSTPVTGQTLNGATFRSGTLPSFGLQVANTPYAPDPETSSNFLRTTAGTVFGAASVAVAGRQGQDVRSFVYGFDGTAARRLHVNSGGQPINARAINVPTDTDIALNAATATSIISQSGNRDIAIVQNLEAPGGDNVRVGDSAVTATRGIRLAPGESVTLQVTAELFAIAEAGAPSVSRTTTSYA